MGQQTEALDTDASIDRTIPVETDEEQTRRSISLIIRIRWIINPAVFLILLAATWSGLGSGSALSRNQLIVNGINLAAVLVLNLAYVVLSRRLANLRPLILFQLLIDVVSITLTVYKTGGVASPFGFLFFFVIFEAAMLGSVGSAYAVAAISSLFYSLTALFDRLGWLPGQEFFSPLSGLRTNEPFVTLAWSFSVASYFGFAALAGYLTGMLARRQRRLRQAYVMLTRRHETLALLHKTSRALNTFETDREVCDSILGELLSHLNLHRALLYRVGQDNSLDLYLVKERTAAGKAVDTYASDPDGRPARTGSGDLGLNVRIPLREDAGLTARCALRQEAYNVAEPEASPDINRELAERIGMNPFAMAPLVIRHRTIGVIGIDRGRDNGAITNEEFRVLQVFANQAAITLFSIDPGAPSISRIE